MPSNSKNLAELLNGDTTITASDLSYPLTGFSSTGIDDNASSTAVTILSDGKVGIGVSSPNEPLHVAGGAVRIGNTNIRHDGSGGSWDMAFETYSGGYYERS